DTGIGIPRSSLSKIGQPFEQVQIQYAKSNGGSGEALKVLGDRLMATVDLDICLEAFALYTGLSQLIRLSIDGLFDPKDAPAGLVELVCRA
ncbi:hypothetical protein ACC764_38335, partial [Rhizobium ruizarguesonis]